MSKLYRKDFVAIADCIRAARTYASDVSTPVVLDFVAKELASYLASTNQYFDKGKFIDYASRTIDLGGAK